ncbi:MAG: radical SAM protein [Desulfosudaceae bacterium]
MKFLALNPKDYYTGWPVQNDFFRERVSIPGLTFPVLKRLLPPGHEMRFLDCLFAPVPMKQYLDIIKEADIVGLSIMSSLCSINYAVAVAQIKRLNPRAFIIAGGHHVNMFPEQWLELGVDLLIRGEAERVFTRLIDEIAGNRQFDKIPGVMFKRDGELVSVPAPPRLDSLDDSPHPDWDLLDFNHYINNFSDRGSPTASLETSRGCDFKCSFCAVPPYWKSTQRHKSVGRVMEEVKQLSARRLKHLVIVDDSFGNDADITGELLEAFRRFPDMPRWSSLLRWDTVLARPELIESLSAAGMRMAMVGFESLHENVLAGTFNKGMRSDVNLKEYRQLYQRFQKNNIMVNGLFMTGHPDIDRREETSYLKARTVCDDPHTVDFMPFPETFGFNSLNRRYNIKNMFFHDMKLPVFESKKPRAFLFNLLNLLDVFRGFQMITSPAYYRSNYFLIYKRLFSKMLRINRRKIRDFRLLTRKTVPVNQRQEELLRCYLEDPEYQHWLDNLSDRIWL